MTDKEKVIQLLLDNGFIGETSELFKNDDLEVKINTEGSYTIQILNTRVNDWVDSYRELCGFLYLKYDKVNISEK